MRIGTQARPRRRLISHWATRYLLDKRYADAVASFGQARQAGEELADYADFLSARANHEAGNDAAAEASLRGFPERYPDSIFVDQAPELEASTLLATNDAAGAQRVLTAPPILRRPTVPAISLQKGRLRSCWGSRDGRGALQEAFAGPPLSPEARLRGQN